MDSAFNVGAFSASANGVLAVRPDASYLRQLVWFDRAGTQTGAVAAADPNGVNYPELSPDGRSVAMDRTIQNNRDVWITELGRGVATRFTFDAGPDRGPIWTGDGKRVIFSANRKSPYDLYSKPANGVSAEELLLESPQNKMADQVSPDGRYLLYWRADAAGSDLWVLPLVGERKPRPVVNSPFEETGGQFSPDGRWLTYQSNESGQSEIYAQAFPGPGGRWQLSIGGGASPRWRRDGKELFYVAPDGKLVALPIQVAGDTLQAGSPVPLFQTQMPSGAGTYPKAQYDVGSDGRFLINTSVEGATSSPITVILNWKPPAAPR